MPELEVYQYILIVLAAMAAGAVNALAGGGTLITFPTLIAFGIPPVVSNVTNTVALCPGYFGATMAQKKDLQGQRKRLLMLLPAGVVGGLVGALLLLNTGEKLFSQLVPFLILLASALLAVQDPLRKFLTRRAGHASGGSPSENWAVLPVGLAAVYGGYFGAGLSVIILAVLGLVLNDNLTRLNALKQSIAFATNIAAAVVFIFSGLVLVARGADDDGRCIAGRLVGRQAGRARQTRHPALAGR